MIAIVILQDIGVVVMMVIVPLLGQPLQNLALATVAAFGKAALFVGIAIVLGLWVLPWLLGQVGGIRTRELFLLTVLILCLGAALGTYVFGLSVVFGAFLIGLVLRESVFVHQALAEITPLRDIFATLFFVSLGMLLSPRFLADNWPLVTATVFIIILLKLLVVFGIVRFFGYGGRIAFLAGAGLFQVGEFGFILAQGGIDAGIISEQFHSLIISSAIITMLLTPLFFGLISRFYPRLAPATARPSLFAEASLPSINSESYLAANPVVIAGYGRVGRNISQGLQEAKIPYIVIEIDPEIISELRYSHVDCIYGDASNIHILSQIDLNRVMALVVTFPDPLAAIATIKAVSSINPRLRILVRVHRKREVELLRDFETVELISPEYEASLEFLKRLLSISSWDQVQVSQILANLRKKQEKAEAIPDDKE